MKRIQATLLTLIALSIAVPAVAQERLTVKFNDPSRPGLLKVNWFNGSITVRTHSSNDVTVDAKSGRNPDRVPPEAGGLRRIDVAGRGLTADSGADNTITVNGPNSIGNGNLEIEVPVKTNLNLHTRNGAFISIDGVEGDIEASNRNGAVNVMNVVGSVVADSMNGKVVVSFREMAAGKPMSFTSMNGSVDVTLPSNTKANLKMRTDNGAIYTDFDVQLSPTTAATPTPEQNGRYRIQIDSTLSGNINGGGTDMELRSRNGNVYLRKAK